MVEDIQTENPHKCEAVHRPQYISLSFFILPLFFLCLAEAISGHQSGQREVPTPLTLWSTVWSERRLPYEHHYSSQHGHPSSFIHRLILLPRLHRSGFPDHLRAQYHCYLTYHHKVLYFKVVERQRTGLQKFFFIQNLDSSY